MSSERIAIMLERADDDWHARVVGVEPPDSELDVDVQYDGSGPADVLEQLGQVLDERDVARIVRERDL
jgi:hypothetical protein